MDLSKLSDADLMALKSGALDKVSDAGLFALKGESAPKPMAPEKSGFAQGVGNTVAGLVRGAGSIGATLLAPRDALESFVARKMGAPELQVPERRKAMDAGLQEMGAQPDSMLYQAGKVGGEVAGTAGAGGVLGNVVGRVAPGAANFAQALATGGFKGGNLATKVAGGAIAGGAAAGLANPDEVGAGAAFGAGLPAAGAVLRGVGTGARKFLAGTTGVGDEALSQAFKAGRTGGQAAQDFTANMRGNSSMDDVLSAAKQNIDAMGQQKQAAYRAGMSNVKADKTVLSFNGVDKAIEDARSLTTFKGQSKNVGASKAVQAAADEIAAWKQLDPAEFHTPEGLDALKQRLNGILESIPFEEKTARKAVGNIYTSIKGEISKQAPEYSKVMQDYSTASETIKEIERAFSLNNKAAADTGMRKLQSLMRNNVNTNYGYRNALADQMMAQGGNNIMPALAGQATNNLAPRGIQAGITGGGGALLTALGQLPTAAAMAAVSSPRLAGEAVYGAGKLAGAADRNALAQALMQAGYRTAPIAGAQ